MAGVRKALARVQSICRWVPRKPTEEKRGGRGGHCGKHRSERVESSRLLNITRAHSQPPFCDCLPWSIMSALDCVGVLFSLFPDGKDSFKNKKQNK